MTGPSALVHPYPPQFIPADWKIGRDRVNDVENVGEFFGDVAGGEFRHFFVRFGAQQQSLS